MDQERQRTAKISVSYLLMRQQQNAPRRLVSSFRLYMHHVRLGSGYKGIGSATEKTVQNIKRH